MASPGFYEDRQAIRKLIDTINHAWLNGPLDQMEVTLGACFHENMIIKGPGLRELCRGRTACARSYKEFVEQSNILDCKLSHAEIDVAGNTAAATYSWNMSYEMHGKRRRESGEDFFVFTRDDGRWWAHWRVILVTREEK
ncbi:MAG TPA: nuclear transport factor 2 family protein [Terriglobales bacterium]|nr:nuclear transport factor 2 family protein [Terriglobales bacterium]